MIKIKKGYTFDDVLLVPKTSSIESRKNVDLSVDLGKGVKLDIPIVSANMKNVTGPHMAEKIASLGGLALIHRFYKNPLVDQLDAFKRVVQERPEYVNHVGLSIGIQKTDLDAANIFVSNGAKIICVDIAHGDHKSCFNIVENIAKRFPEVLLIAGNVASPSGVKNLANAGANVIKVGVGPGSLCTTRIETGNGVPQLTALSEAYDIVQSFVEGSGSWNPINGVKYTRNYQYKDVKIIADGGIKAAGDIVKALCFSHCVMLGNLLAGTDEAPGDIVQGPDGKTYKQYAGSSTHKSNHIEGVAGLVPTKGSVSNIITKLLEGVRSGCSYQGVANLNDLKKNPEFVLLSNAGLVESHPHNVIL